LEQAQKTSLLLEMNLRFLSANLQLNALILNSLGNSKAKEESQVIIKNILTWLRTLNQYVELDSTKILVDALIDSVDKSNRYNLLFEDESSSSKTNMSNTKENSSLNSIINESEIQQRNNFGHEKEKEDQLSGSDIGDLLKHNIDDLINDDDPFIDKEEKKFFRRNKSVNDQWDYISTIKSFMSSYTNLMHILIPNLALEVAVELNRYGCDNKLLLHDSITHPTLAFQNLITKLLREAPGSNLFRRIRRNRLDKGIDINFDESVNASEAEQIKNLVISYFETLTKYLDPSNPVPPGIDTLYEKTKGNYRKFSLGPLTIETRLTAVIKNVTESSFKEAEESISNEAASTSTKAIYLATTQLLCDFQNFLLQESRIRRFLEELKS
jgi:hypothetical protein